MGSDINTGNGARLGEKRIRHKMVQHNVSRIHCVTVSKKQNEYVDRCLSKYVDQCV